MARCPDPSYKDFAEKVVILRKLKEDERATENGADVR